MTSAKTPTAKAGTAVATPKDHDLALYQQYEDDAGAGFEEANRDAFAIPFLVRLQDLSPQVKPKMAGYIKGAKPGQILQSVSQELYGECRVIPCYFSQVFIEWTPRERKGGGLVAIHPANTPLAQQITRNDRNEPILPNGNLLVDTRQHFCLLVKKDGTVEQCLIPMSSTAIKHSRRWMSQMRAAVIEVDGRIISPPSFAWSYRLSTEEEANDQGSWWAWKIDDRQRVTDTSQYLMAKAFNKQMKDGSVKVDYDNLHKAQGGGAESPTDLDDDNDLDA